MTDTAGRNQPVLPPGRELDTLVAEKVGMPPVLTLNGKPHPAYSTEWSAMRLVVERLVALDYAVRILVADDGAICTVVRRIGPITAEADTLPHAVALAALKAVEATNA